MRRQQHITLWDTHEDSENSGTVQSRSLRSHAWNSPEFSGWIHRLLVCAALACQAVLGAGCGSQPEDRTTTTEPPAPDLSRGVISMAPNITETVFALGQQTRLVAIGKFDDYPLETAGLPKVGGAIDPDLERIAALRPGLILTSGDVPKVKQYGSASGIPVINLTMDSLEGIHQGITEIGALLACAHESATLLAAMELRRRSLEFALAQRSHPKVLLVTGRMTHDFNALPSANGKSFLSELVSVAGGDNIFSDAPQTYFEASKEQVVARAPEAILEFHCGENLSDTDKKAFVADWQALPTLPAVKNGRVHIITETHAMRPGPRVYEVAALFAHLLHPDAEIAP